MFVCGVKVKTNLSKDGLDDDGQAVVYSLAALNTCKGVV